MARYIDADELIKCIPSEEYNSRFAVFYAPTADVRENVYGKWISVCNGKQCNCSICGTGYDHTYEFIEKWNFCPNCGAENKR